MSEVSHGFQKRKQTILSGLATPDTQYTDLSPKGSVDQEIKSLIGDINTADGFVTTSSCSGRVSVFLEGSRLGVSNTGSVDPRNSNIKPAKAGGKGGGGRWLYTTHVPVQAPRGSSFAEMFQLQVNSGSAHSTYPKIDSSTRYVHFKFEPMILHILTASASHAQVILNAALYAGFRESGAINLIPRKPETSSTPMVAVRSTGLSIDSIVGYILEDNTTRSEYIVSMVSEEYLTILVGVANQRFSENIKRIELFRATFLNLIAAKELGDPPRKPSWEDPETRRLRKRREGLERRRELEDKEYEGEHVKTLVSSDVNDDSDLGPLGLPP